MSAIANSLTPRTAQGRYAPSASRARAALPVLSSSCDSTRDAATTPPVHRGSMPAQPWVGFWRSLGRGLVGSLRRLLTSWAAPARPAMATDAAGLVRQRAGHQRRRVFMLLIALSTASTATLFAHAQPTAPTALAAWMQVGQIALYALLSAWVTSGFVTALMGAWVLLRGDRHALSGRSVRHHRLSAEARTAVIMPICHEDVATVFAGLRATCESLATTARSQGFAPTQFDVFVLSDSSRPEVLAAERAAWEELRATLATADLPQVEVYYRARRRRTHRKAGNVADFCRRWGRDYRYMVVLDADSVMSGDSLATLVKLMEANPQAGIIQTATQAVGHVTLHARAQQFASRVTGRLFTLGMQFWQLGESHYWGHNAIIRVEPFMRHCALAPIQGQGGLSGPILSHDFVEAALMRRAGWEVWLVSDIEGSYEQQPPDLLAELQRDRRWCQGNLQNAQLMAEPGLHPVHRAMFVTGALAYLSAPLWLAFLTLGGVLWFTGAGHPSLGAAWTGAFTMSGELAWLWAWTLCLLFVPRLLGLLAVLLKREQRFHGGARKLLQSAMLEALLALLQAPIRMVAHSLFVLIALTGWKLEWKSPPREAAAVPWAHALRQFAPASLVLPMLVCGVAAFEAWNATQASYPLWSLLLILLPVGLPLLLAAPLTVLSSQPGLGSALRKHHWLLIPQEAWPKAVLRRAWRHAGA
ncbi:glucosyl transferase family 2 [Hylemonella gracilis str. Niagara R]|uniref:Glucans biosynthesis glucosyltransferase H n=1 Tax=Hylemonella gracilis str. Niagara R TaxID=1458275 RepID=A0A016XKL1_9BURK|nr:glucans biosynthesis glucosyltransferase MdoH [Hylemonella gracilis]EYC52391.1 glucosyl transferase family 2 [Hylemonella gracilis str. Niagara R]